MTVMAAETDIETAANSALALTSDEERVVRSVLASLRRIRYGSVQITVQDGRVVQIDTLEKQRFAPGAPPAGSGAVRPA
jgi:hypothetical protein